MEGAGPLHPVGPLAVLHAAAVVGYVMVRTEVDLVIQMGGSVGGQADCWIFHGAVVDW